MCAPEGRRPAALLLAFVLALLPAAGLRGQEKGAVAPCGDRLGAETLRKFSLDLGAALSAPTHWSGSDFLLFGLAAGATAALASDDEALSRSVRSLSTPKTADGFVAQLGNGYFLIAFNTVFYLAGEVFDSRELRVTALVGMESFLAASAVVLTVKAVVGRARPSAREGPDRFHPFAFQNRYSSFPSGDAAGAFAVAAVIADRSDSPLVDALAYGLAGLAALNRVHDGKHWVSDVFAGSVLGFFIGRKISALNRGRGEQGPRLSIGPASTGLGWSVGLAF
jgi:membrane-associated phospholipid phosphatase